MKNLILAIIMLIGLNGCKVKQESFGICTKVICIEGVSYLDSRCGNEGSVCVMYNKDGSIRQCKGE